MIVELQAERDRLSQAIEALEKLSAGTIGRRGRPPRWLKEQIERQSAGSETREADAPFKKKA